jgi:glycosyltransferase involved in cell wall biosynthesis
MHNSVSYLDTAATPCPTEVSEAEVRHIPPPAEGASGRKAPTKILYVMDTLHGGDRVGGTEGQFLQLLGRLDRRRFEPHLALFRPTAYAEEAANISCPVTVLNIQKLLSARSVGKLLQLTSRVHTEGFSLVHVFLTDASLAAPLFCRLGGAKVVVSRRDMGFWYTPKALRVLRISNLLVSRIITNSQAVKLNVHKRERYPLRAMEVFYNGHDPSRFDVAPLPGFRERLGIGASDPIIGMVANLSPWKRQSDLLHAFAMVHQQHPSAHLVLVGTGSMEASLKQMARAIGLDGRVHLIGGVVDAVPVVKHFTVGVLCSESEGLSNAVIEYMGAGKPTVCTNVGGNPEIISDGQSGFLVDPGDLATLAARLNYLLVNAGVREHMSRTARLRAQQLTSQHMATRHMDLYARLTNSD